VGWFIRRLLHDSMSAAGPGELAATCIPLPVTSLTYGGTGRRAAGWALRFGFHRRLGGCGRAGRRTGGGDEA
jgi:hypothetical protein